VLIGALEPDPPIATITIIIIQRSNGEATNNKATTINNTTR
jgi:hypothetical protein